MSGTGSRGGTVLEAGAARRVINPPLGIGKGGLRLFGDPIQAIESDLTATVLVVADGTATVAVIAMDLCTMTRDEARGLRAAVGEALDTPISHVLLNLSHNHSSPTLPWHQSMIDTPAELAVRERYERDLTRRLVEAALEARGRLQPARLGSGWGESSIGVYRRESRDGRDVLGEVHGHAIDRSVGVLRVDDLDGGPIAVLFRYSAHPVTVGPRSMVASSDFPGPARDVVERSLGGLALFLQGCGGNVNPAVGIGYEVDCRDTKNRVGLELGGEVLRVAAGIRTNRRRGERTPLGTVPNVLFTPWLPVEGDTCTSLVATEETIALEYGELPTPERAAAIHARWQETLDGAIARDARTWEIRVAKKYESWARALEAAVAEGHPTCDLTVQALRVNDVVLVGVSAETFFETGLDVMARSPFPDTFVLGYTNGLVAYLPRAEDYPDGGWQLEGDYAVPDLMPQAWQLPVAFRPDSADRVVECAAELIARLA
jgi:hypothetical protein